MELLLRFTVYWVQRVNSISGRLGVKVEPVGGVNDPERDRRSGREQLSLRKAAYIPTSLRGETPHTHTHTISTISCVCFRTSASPLRRPPDLRHLRSTNKHWAKEIKKLPGCSLVRCLKDLQLIWETIPTLLAGFTTSEFKRMRWLHINNISKPWVVQWLCESKSGERKCYQRKHTAQKLMQPDIKLLG